MLPRFFGGGRSDTESESEAESASSSEDEDDEEEVGKNKSKPKKEHFFDFSNLSLDDPAAVERIVQEGSACLYLPSVVSSFTR